MVTNTPTAAPIIKSFRILGLHGYKDIELDFQGPARIAIAENGTGKTTILSALYAFLVGDFERLRNVSFESIECELTGRAEPLILRHEQLGAPFDSQKILELSRWSDLDAGELRRVLLGIENAEPHTIAEHPVLNEIFQRSPYGYPELASIVRDIQKEWEAHRSGDLKAIASEVKTHISPCEILYLPTYRRVELSLGKRSSERQRRYFGRGYPAPTRRGARFADIRFGLTDVDDRLRELVTEIQKKANFGYRQISANIIDELLTRGLPYSGSEISSLPDIDALALFLSRIETRVAVDKRLNQIRELYGTGKHGQSDTMLRYFLSKLSSVVDQTKVLEATIEKFVEKSNLYLQQSSDEKCLQYDPRKMRVVVQNLWTKKEVDLDDLSSGEKQVVSLFAHMYLYQQRKIVLIDEPELSLSIDWQKRLLPDVLSSPTCAQLLAITHSPFIFDNELDPFAGPVHITRRAVQA